MKRIFACLVLVNCINGPGRPLLGASAPTPAQVQTCQSELSTRSWASVLAGAFGGAGGLVGAGAADFSSGTAKAGLQITSISVGVVALASVIVGSVTSNKYTANRCDTVLATVAP
jgi:hypothetical protein